MKGNWPPRKVLMELLWWSHLVTLLCISSLLSVNYTWLTRCLRDSECEASICEWVITLEREAGRIYHSLTWQDVLQLSLVESFQPQLSSGTTSPRYMADSGWVGMSLCGLFEKVHNCSIRFQSYCAFVQVGLIAHRTGLSDVCWHRWFVFTQGPIWML